MNGRKLRLGILVLTLGATSCGTVPRERRLACAPNMPAAPASEATLDVLTYNIEGLSWPARTGRKHKLQQIGRILKSLNEAGSGPDVVLFQEAFSKAAVNAVQDAGYASLIAGPTRTQRSTLSSDIALPGRARPRRGELGIRLMSSGLVIASRYAVLSAHAEPYAKGSCAGFDCLANKGVMLVALAVPGSPDPIYIANTHMNAQKASRVAPARHLASHNSQSLQLGQFLARHWDQDSPLILGGDFNMRRSPGRFDFFAGLESLTLVHQFCLDRPSCNSRMSWDGDEPWMDTQDLQFFVPGKRVAVEPVGVEAMFDGRPDSPALSDHDGFRVRYRLRWNDAARASYRCPGP